MMIGNFGFDLKSLEIFVSTVDAGNMTIAAEKLGTTQSAVSQNLANLERSLEAQLLDRTVRPIEVTTAGRFLYDSAQQMLKQAEKPAKICAKLTSITLTTLILPWLIHWLIRSVHLW